MPDTKSIFMSRTIWSNIVGFLCLAASILGVQAGTIDQGALVDAILQVITGASFLLSCFWRVVAKDRLLG
jgi:hypothetical protein